MCSCTAVDCLHDSSNLPPYNTLRALRRKSVRRARIEFGLTRGGTSPIFWNWPELLGIEFRSENQGQIAPAGAYSSFVWARLLYAERLLRAWRFSMMCIEMRIVREQFIGLVSYE